MVPVLMQAPPSTGFRSASSTRLPSLAAWIAAFWPPGPVPITTMSTCFMSLRSLDSSPSFRLPARAAQDLLSLCEIAAPLCRAAGAPGMQLEHAGAGVATGREVAQQLGPVDGD